MSLLLDTHAAVWATADDPRLGSLARTLLGEIGEGDAAISAVSLLEIAMLIDKGRIIVSVAPETYLGHLESTFRILPLCSGVAAASVRIALPQGDPFDRVIVATAVRHGLTLLTRDKLIRRSGLVPVIW